MPEGTGRGKRGRGSGSGRMRVRRDASGVRAVKIFLFERERKGVGLCTKSEVLSSEISLLKKKGS